MNILKNIHVFLLLLIIGSACSLDNNLIQKRKYQKGYHVSFKKNNTGSSNITKPIYTDKAETSEQINKSCVATLLDEKNYPLSSEQNIENNNTHSSHPIKEPLHENKINRVKHSFNTIKSKAKQTVQKAYKMLPEKINNKEGITAKQTFNSDFLTVAVMLILLTGAILVFQMIEGSTGLIIGLVLIAGIIVIMAT